MNINKYSSSYTQGRKMSPMRRSVNLYDAHFSKEQAYDDTQHQNSNVFQMPASTSFS
jgi:hypothetical protein